MDALCGINSPNAQAFMKLIRYAEHYPDESDNFYFSLYGGGRFTDPSRHPNKAVTKWGHTSTAAGAYQILYSTWAEAKRHGEVLDFSAASQDILAFEKIRSRGALSAVCAGDVSGACLRLTREWTSLPGGAQTRMTFAIAQAAFIRFGGVKP